MKDWISDWKRWSRAERCFAIALVILSLAVPFGLVIGGRIIGTSRHGPCRGLVYQIRLSSDDDGQRNLPCPACQTTPILKL
jgi:hypothetical protein